MCFCFHFFLCLFSFRFGFYLVFFISNIDVFLIVCFRTFFLNAYLFLFFIFLTTTYVFAFFLFCCVFHCLFLLVYFEVLKFSILYFLFFDELLFF